MLDFFTATIEFLEISPIFAYSMVFIYGILIGSFLNVVIYRLPIMMDNEYISIIRGITELPDETLTSKMSKKDKEKYYELRQMEELNLSFPSSRCGACGSKIKIWQNIPIISYLILGGKCGACKKSYSPRYLFVELFVGLLWVYIYNQYGLTLETLTYITLFTGLTASAFIDAEHRVLPDSITFGGMGLGLLFAIFAESHHVSIESAVIGMITGYLGTYVFVKGYEKLRRIDIAMGEGDMKLYALAGAFVGIENLIYLIILSTIIGLLQFILLIPFKKKLKEYQLPFGPAIIVAIFIFVMYPDFIAQILAL